LSSLTSFDSVKKLKTIGVRSVFWLLLNTVIAIVLALAAGLLFGVGKNAGILLETADVSAVEGLQSRIVPFTDVVVNFFPSNIVKDVAENNIIPIILFSILLAVAYAARSGEKGVLPFKELVNAVKNVIYTAVDFIVELTPYAVVVLVASAVSKAANAVSAILPLLLLLLVTYLVCAVHTYIINGALIFGVAKLNPFRFFRKIANAQATAFTTQSSVGTLPVTINNLTKRVGVSEEIANFTAPLGTAVGMPGCSGIWPVLVAIFAIHALHIEYSVPQYITLSILALAVSLGTAGVPGTATVTATTVFVAAGLPVEVIILLLPISTLADMARTATNVTAAAVTSVIIAKKEGELDLSVFHDERTNV
jgi:Na+/H+-dicarboxylate symporter